MTDSSQTEDAWSPQLRAVVNAACELVLETLQQDPNVALRPRPELSRLDGLVGITNDTSEWMYCTIDPDEVDRRGARAVAQDFVKDLRAARGNNSAAKDQV